MALSNPRIVYGVHSFTPYDRKSGLPKGTVLTIGDSTFSLEGELVQLNGGSAKFPFAVEESTITAELTVAPKSYPDFLFELFLGKAPTANAAEALGSVTSLTNKNGTSLQDATTGVASVGVTTGSEDDLKFTRYVVKAVTATTVDVFALSNIDFARGTDKEFEDDLLKITASPLTIATSATVVVPGFGVELIGGSGAIAMTADDTAMFSVRPKNDESMEVTIGGSSDVFPEFGAIVMAQQRGNGEMLELDIFRLKAAGLPFNLAEKAFSEPEITATAFFDSAQGGVFTTRHVSPTSPC